MAVRSTQAVFHLNNADGHYNHTEKIGRKSKKDQRITPERVSHRENPDDSQIIPPSWSNLMPQSVKVTPAATALALFTACLMWAFASDSVAQNTDDAVQQQIAQLNEQIQVEKALNAELATRVADLTRELKLAQETIRTQQTTIARLEQQLAAAGVVTAETTNTTAPESDQVTIDETLPNASPRALFNAVVAGYRSATDGMQTGKPGDSARMLYLRTLEIWRAATARDLRAAINWHVRVVGAKPGPGKDRILILVAIDPVTQARLGQPFDTNFPQAMANRLATWESRGTVDVLQIRGTLIPDIRINEDRPERGTFDNPPFIGPFAEFGFRVEVASIKRVIAGEKDTPQP